MPSTSPLSGPTSTGGRLTRAAQVIVVSSVMFTFISYWRTAAVVLCDLASTAYYIGGIVESSIGAAAPWFILGVMVFSYAVRSVYIESCSLFVRGGVYRVVKEAMGGFLAKLSVSALMFDYILTGPISGVSAGQYLIGLGLATVSYFTGAPFTKETEDAWKTWGSVVIACAITFYFFRQNLIGIHESSDKALKIMIATTVMAVVILAWSGITIGARLTDPDQYGQVNNVPGRPDLQVKTIKDEKGQEVPKMNPITGEAEDPTGFLGNTGLGAELHRPPQDYSWWGLVGLVGIAIAFGHSILAMSGEETLAQVYREVEAPKMKNFQKAAFIVFVYSLVLTAGISFLAVMLIPHGDRVDKYADNLISGLAMNMVGPEVLRLFLNAFVVIIGFLILSGAVNTAIIGSNGVLNRVSEDGVMPEWFLKPHPRYGTTHRILYLILGLQLFTIIGSRGDVLLLGEAYAFGVVWSFVFKALAMLVLRFKEPEGREYKVPFNLRVGGVELPIGLAAIFLVLLVAAIMNLLTKETATTWGLSFTAAFLVVFLLSEHFHERRRAGEKHKHLDHFNQELTQMVTPATLGLKKHYRKLVSIRSPQNLFMLEKALDETDPETTDVIVMTAKLSRVFDPLGLAAANDLDSYDQHLMTAVVERAERAGKEIKPIIVPTNNPLNAILQTAKDLQVQELVIGASNKFTAEEQLDQVSFYWITLHDGSPAPLTVRILNRQRDVSFDLEGGNRIPKISERKARSMAELRAAGVGVDRVLLAHDGSAMAGDLFRSVWTMLDPGVVLDFADAAGNTVAGAETIRHDQERARHLGREIVVHPLGSDWGADLVRLAQDGAYDLVILPLPARHSESSATWKKTVDHVLAHAHCPVSLTAQPLISQEVSET